MGTTVLTETVALVTVTGFATVIASLVMTERAVRRLHVNVVRRVTLLRRLPVDDVIRASLRRVMWLILVVYGPSRRRSFAGSFTIRAWRVSAFLMMVYLGVLPAVALGIAGIVEAVNVATSEEASPAIRALVTWSSTGAPWPALNLSFLMVGVVGLWVFRTHRRIRSPRPGERRAAERATAFGRLLIRTHLLMWVAIPASAALFAGGFEVIGALPLFVVLAASFYTSLLAPIRYFGPTLPLVVLSTLMAMVLRVTGVTMGFAVVFTYPTWGWIAPLLLLALPLIQLAMITRGRRGWLTTAVLLDALVVGLLGWLGSLVNMEYFASVEATDYFLTVPTVTIGILALCLANATSDAASVGLSRYFFGRSTRSGTFAGLLAFLVVDLVAVLALVVVNVVIIQAVLGIWIVVVGAMPDIQLPESPLAIMLTFYQDFVTKSADLAALLGYVALSQLQGSTHPNLAAAFEAMPFTDPTPGFYALFAVVLVALTVAIPTLVQMLLATVLLAAKAGAMVLAPILAWMHLKMTDRPDPRHRGITISERRFTLFLVCFLGAVALRGLGVPWVDVFGGLPGLPSRP